MNKNYKVGFYILLGILVVGIFSSSIFIFKINSKPKSSSKENNNIEKMKKNNLEQLEQNNDEKKDEHKSIEKNNVKSNTTKKKKIIKNNSQSNISMNKNVNNSKTKNENESEIINYVKDKYNLVKGSISKENAKKIFIEIVDFMFYDGEIKGHKLCDFSSSAKVQISNLCTKIEIEIENKFPNLIDETESKYKEKKDYFLKAYSEIIKKYCESDNDFCVKTKNEYEKIKSTFEKTFEKIDNSKNKIEKKVKDKFNNWYTNFKNS